MDTKIIIALHKPYQVPEYKSYLPVHVGAVGKPEIFENRDDTGDNISGKNPYFCELTGLYWAWKNLDYEALGLVHYRRYFSAKKKYYIRFHGAFKSVLSDDEIETLMASTDIVVPAKRKYYIETLYSHYGNTHDAEHLNIARNVIRDRHPDMLRFVDQAYSSTYGYMFNMAIMKRKYWEDYLSFLFDVLFEMEKLIDPTVLDDFSARLFGRVSEILFTAWIFKQLSTGQEIVEVPVIDMEPVDWFRKGIKFLRAKFMGEKYSKSM